MNTYLSLIRQRIYLYILIVLAMALTYTISQYFTGTGPETISRWTSWSFALAFIITAATMEWLFQKYDKN